MEKSTHKKKEEAHSSRHEHEVTTEDFEDVKTILSWEAPGRPFREKKREYYLSVILVAFLLEVIAFLFSQYELMMVIAAIAFLAIAMSYVPPSNLRYQISTEGLSVGDHFYLWQELYDFYFKKVDRVEVLHIRTMDMIPGELKITVGDMSADHLRKILVQFLPYREVVRTTFTERAGDWLARTFPLEG